MKKMKTKIIVTLAIVALSALFIAMSGCQKHTGNKDELLIKASPTEFTEVTVVKNDGNSVSWPIKSFETKVPLDPTYFIKPVGVILTMADGEPDGHLHFQFQITKKEWLLEVAKNNPRRSARIKIDENRYEFPLQVTGGSDAWFSPNTEQLVPQELTEVPDGPIVVPGGWVAIKHHDPDYLGATVYTMADQWRYVQSAQFKDGFRRTINNTGTHTSWLLLKHHPKADTLAVTLKTGAMLSFVIDAGVKVVELKKQTSPCMDCKTMHVLADGKTVMPAGMWFSRIPSLRTIEKGKAVVFFTQEVLLNTQMVIFGNGNENGIGVDFGTALQRTESGTIMMPTAIITYPNSPMDGWRVVLIYKQQKFTFPLSQQYKELHPQLLNCAGGTPTLLVRSDELSPYETIWPDGTQEVIKEGCKN